MNPEITVHYTDTDETIVREMTDEEAATVKPDGPNGWDGSYPSTKP
jgi:hypothetical protein